MKIRVTFSKEEYGLFNTLQESCGGNSMWESIGKKEDVGIMTFVCDENKKDEIESTLTIREDAFLKILRVCRKYVPAIKQVMNGVVAVIGGFLKFSAFQKDLKEEFKEEIEARKRKMAA